MRKFNLELTVGLFVIAGIVCLGYLSIELGRRGFMGGEGYEIHAFFSNTGGLQPGASVVIAGVEVGHVKSVSLDEYRGRVTMTLPKDVDIQEDAIASIKTKGLIGERYVEITPGGSEDLIEPGGRLRDTQPAVNLQELISKYVFGKI